LGNTSFVEETFLEMGGHQDMEAGQAGCVLEWHCSDYQEKHARILHEVERYPPAQCKYLLMK